MKILMLDPSGIFGYAFGDPFGNHGPPWSGTFKVPDGTPSTKLIAVERFLIDLIKANEITNVYVEEPFLGKRQSFQSVTAIAGYVMVSGMAAAKCHCKCATTPMATWRSELGLPTRGPKNVLSFPEYAHLANNKTGLKVAQRKWVKDKAFEFAVKHGSSPKDDNESDAICMYWWKANKLRQRLAEVGQKKDLFDELKV